MDMKVSCTKKQYERYQKYGHVIACDREVKQNLDENFHSDINVDLSLDENKHTAHQIPFAKNGWYEIAKH